MVRRSHDLRPSVGQGPRQVGTATHAAHRAPWRLRWYAITSCALGWRGGHGSDGDPSHEVERDQAVVL